MFSNKSFHVNIKSHSFIQTNSNVDRWKLSVYGNVGSIMSKLDHVLDVIDLITPLYLKSQTALHHDQKNQKR